MKKSYLSKMFTCYSISYVMFPVPVDIWVLSKLVFPLYQMPIQPFADFQQNKMVIYFESQFFHNLRTLISRFSRISSVRNLKKDCVDQISDIHH